jgi:hypothetical protein
LPEHEKSEPSRPTCACPLCCPEKWAINRAVNHGVPVGAPLHVLLHPSGAQVVVHEVGSVPVVAGDASASPGRSEAQDKHSNNLVSSSPEVAQARETLSFTQQQIAVNDASNNLAAAIERYAEGYGKAGLHGRWGDLMRAIDAYASALLAQQETEIARLSAQVLKCHVCGKPACCIGNYEGADHYEPACDSCCGHGNEDGWCRPIAEAIAEMSQWILEANTREPDESAAFQITQLKARAEAAEAALAALRATTEQQHVFIIEHGDYSNRGRWGDAYASLDAAVAAIKGAFIAPYIVAWKPLEEGRFCGWTLTGEFEHVQNYSIKHTAQYDIQRVPVLTPTSSVPSSDQGKA